MASGIRTRWDQGSQAMGSGITAPGSGITAPGSGITAPGSGITAPGSGITSHGIGVSIFFREPQGIRLRYFCGIRDQNTYLSRFVNLNDQKFGSKMGSATKKHISSGPFTHTLILFIPNGT